MRALILVSSLILSSAALAETTPPPKLSGPVTEDVLRQLDSDQLRLLRRASRSCPSIGAAPGIKKERDPCVISSTDKAVADSGNPDLQAFHNALAPSDRYDENRTQTAWQVWLTKP